MKKKLFNALKILVPIIVGVYLLLYFYNALSKEQKESFFSAIESANYFWIFVSLVLSFLSHIFRAIRWKYLLEPMGYQTSFWHRYHATMAGYIINLTVPRAGEASRAGLLLKTDQVSFTKSFGTIVAERAIDVILLGIVFLLAIGIQFDDFIVLKNKLLGGGSAKSDSNLTLYLLIAGAIVLVGGILLFFFNKTIFNKVKALVFGLKDGFLSIFKSKNPFPFIVYSFLIWTLYVGFFIVSLYALPDIASKVPFGGMLLAFIGGTIGIIFIQGGIGAYPIIVGVIITFYVHPEIQTIEPHPKAYALGNIIWVAQTLLMIVLGLISLFYFSKNFKSTKHESSRKNQ